MADRPVSTQTNFTGQQGWNDCIPEVDKSKPRTNRKVRRVFQDLNPGSRTSSLSVEASSRCSSVSGETAPPPARPTYSPNAPPPRAVPSPVPVSSTGKSTLSQVLALVEQSQLSDDDKVEYRSLFEKTIPALDQTDLLVISQVIASPDHAQAQETLTQHSSANGDLTVWTVPLLKVIESQK